MHNLNCTYTQYILISLYSLNEQSTCSPDQYLKYTVFSTEDMSVATELLQQCST